VAEPQIVEDCELTFGEGLVLSEAGEVALEDYARVLTTAVRAEAVRDGASGSRITSVRIVGSPSSPSVDQHRDIEDFARSLAAEAGGLGLGWS
jgi:hypothetical protein